MNNQKNTCRALNALSQYNEIVADGNKTSYRYTFFNNFRFKNFF